MTMGNMQYISKLFSIFDRRQKVKLFGIFMMLTIGAGLEVVGIGLILPFVTLVQSPDHILQYVGPGTWVGNIDMSLSHIIILMGLALLAFYIMKNAYLAYSYVTQFRFVYGALARLAERLLDIYLRQPYAFHLRKNTAELLKHVTVDLFQVFNHNLVPVLILASEVIVTACLLATIFFMDPVIAMISVGILGGLSFVFYYLVRAKTDDLGKQNQFYQEQFLREIHEAFGGIKEIKVLCREAFYLDGFRQNMKEQARTQRYPQIINQFPRLFIETLLVIALLLIVIMTQARGQNFQEATPTLALFAMASYRLLPSINRILSMLTMIRYFKVSVDVIHKDLEDLPEFHHSRSGIETVETETPSIFQKEVALVNVSFTYPESSHAAIEDVNLTIRKGSSVAFVGPTGSGKTTLVDLMLGLHVPSHGSILVDGVDTKNDLHSWKRCIGYVPQSIFLSDGNIRRNVAFGISEDRIDEGKIWCALEAAQILTMVRALPQGLDTAVGERGVRLSGGERQRIGIARALYHQPEFLIMDEATASLDHETENAVTEAIECLSHKFTMIVIAHRLSTVRNCDKIYRIEGGRCMGPVSYEQLKAVI
jgi:ATP-binding cassette, subfamily B, bacterial PglK